MALSNENPKGEIQDCALTKETCNNHVHAMYVKFGELAINTLQVQLRRDGGSCLSKTKYKMFQPDLDVCVNFTCVRRHHHMSNETTLFQDSSTEMSD